LEIGALLPFFEEESRGGAFTGRISGVRLKSGHSL